MIDQETAYQSTVLEGGNQLLRDPKEFQSYEFSYNQPNDEYHESSPAEFSMAGALPTLSPIAQGGAPETLLAQLEPVSSIILQTCVHGFADSTRNVPMSWITMTVDVDMGWRDSSQGANGKSIEEHHLTIDFGFAEKEDDSVIEHQISIVDFASSSSSSATTTGLPPGPMQLKNEALGENTIAMSFNFILDYKIKCHRIGSSTFGVLLERKSQQDFEMLLNVEFQNGESEMRTTWYKNHTTVLLSPSKPPHGKPGWVQDTMLGRIRGQVLGTPQKTAEPLEGESRSNHIHQTRGSDFSLIGGGRREKGLCTTCKDLDLTPDKFIIDNNADAVRNPSSLLPQPRPLRISEFRLKSRSSKTGLGNLGEIFRQMDQCPLCSLIARSVLPRLNHNRMVLSGADRVAFLRTYEEATCFFAWEIDGREAVGSDFASARSINYPTKSRTRRLRLSWSHQDLEDSYLVFLTPERLRMPNSDARYAWAAENRFLGRDPDHNEGRQALINSWLDLCQRNHGGFCSGLDAEAEEFLDMAEESHFGVVDVVDLHIKPLPLTSELPPQSPSQRYTSVTFEPYVALSYVWGKENFYTTTSENVMVHRRQGGLEPKEHLLPAAVRDAIDLVRRLGLRYLWRMASTPRLGCKPCIITRSSDRLWEECAPGMRLIIKKSPEKRVTASRWNRRAWTFQERLLSKRCLIFAEGRAYFQCRSSGMSEDIFNDQKGFGWSLDLVNAPLQMLRELRIRPIWVYAKSVSLYTAREPTKPKGVLAAFQGICNLMERRMGAPFVFVLPTSHFDFAILWEQNAAFHRRRPDPDDPKQVAEYDGLEFPSWSWSGWMGATVEYKPDMLEGCLNDVRSLLMSHTWIIWHVRDGHGNLRPLWDKSKGRDDDSTDWRWKGYGMIDAEKSETSSLREDKPSEHLSFEGYKAKFLDEYGKFEPRKTPDPGRFERCLPENPFRVNFAKYSRKTDQDPPDQPILQFYTWHTWLYIAPATTPAQRDGSRLCRYDVADERGDWCGSVVLGQDWLDTNDVSRNEFIALSDAKAFTQDECDTWTYYIPREREESEWDLFYVLLVEQNDWGWQRVALGKVFKAAFSKCTWKEILLT